MAKKESNKKGLFPNKRPPVTEADRKAQAARPPLKPRKAPPKHVASQTAAGPGARKATKSLDPVNMENRPEFLQDTTEVRELKKATMAELKQARKVRHREEKALELKAKNAERGLKGKSKLKDPNAFKPSIWEKTAEASVYRQLREMGDSTKAIDKFQRKRVFMSTLLAAFVIPIALFFSKWFLMAVPIVWFVFYKMQGKRVDSFYRAWKFERQLNFSKFTRLVIPYLKASGGTMALYTIFNKILNRTENEADKRSLYQLMGEMGDTPESIQPFIDYAERSSGTDMSHLFMTTIFDFQQSTFDTSVIDELGQMASEDMMESIDEIIAMKLKRFAMFPTKGVMSSFILVAGLAVGIMINNLSQLDFSSGMDIQAPSAGSGIEEYDPEATVDDDEPTDSFGERESEE